MNLSITTMAQQPLISHIVHEILDVMSPMDLMKLAISKIDKMGDISIIRKESEVLLKAKRQAMIKESCKLQHPLIYEQVRVCSVSYTYFLVDDYVCVIDLHLHSRDNDWILLMDGYSLYVTRVMIYSDGLIKINGIDRTATCKIYIQPKGC
jgi:hypothetical protein